jgi:asparaginyl-tRNA synthetase
MSTYYIDETAGSDETGVGSIEKPFQSLAFALFKAGAETPKLLSRKDPNSEYDEPTQSSLKKARKNADGLEKKRKKAEELAERAATAQNADRERREKALEESRKIVLKEDESLPKAVTVRALMYLARAKLILE